MRFSHLSNHGRVMVACVASFAFAVSAIGADAPTGEQIYRKQCATCHGATGEGVKGKYDDALIGDKSPAQLSKIIAKTMPEDAPGTCVGPDADKVAAYMFDAFYSKDAQARNKPPRVELSRLTVRQYRNSIADLIGSFRGTSEKWDATRGLKAMYYSGRGFKDKKLERVDPEIRFDWKTASPDPKVEADQFSVQWSGGVLADETGEYEFVIRSDHAVRLWVNDTRKPLIDAWVKSGTDTEFRGSIFLLGGRVHPIKLEFSKAKQGVDDSKKGAKPPPAVPAFAALEWKPPRGARSVIPRQNLSPNRFQEVFVVTTAFPPDDRSLGWERGTTVSKEWDAAITDGAIETAGFIVSRLNELLSKDAKLDRTVKLRNLAQAIVEKAFRRPLSEEEKRVFVMHQFEVAKDPELAFKRVVLLTLMSPRFLYREASGGPEAYAVASRLSYALWDSPPDDLLLKAAAENKLATREQVAAQAERMLGDMRARAKMRDFLHTWLKVDQATDMAKDAKRYPGFDAAIIADLRLSLDLMLDDVAWSDKPDFRRLLLADDLYLNERLAKFYGTSVPADAGFQKVKLNADKRAGVLTHPYLMANFAYSGSTSPIHRGVFVARGVLGLNLRPPQEAFTPLDEKLHPNLTTRERVSLQTKGANCQACHTTINSLGFTLESFDAVGRFRDKDNNKPVDTTGSYLTKTGDSKFFKNVREMAVFLASSEEVHAAFVEQMFHHLVKQPVRAYGMQKPAELKNAFASSEFNIRKLAVEIATATAIKPSVSPIATTRSGGGQ